MIAMKQIKPTCTINAPIEKVWQDYYFDPIKKLLEQ
jgi:hypothetical protein